MATGASSLVRLPVGFAGADPPDSWPPPSSLPSPSRLAGSVQGLDGVGPTLERRLARVGVEAVGDLLWQGPRRYEAPAPTKRICDLFGEEEAVIEVAVRSVTSRRRGRLKILTATVYDDTGSIKATWFNQPWLEKRLEPGTALRLRGRANRYGFAVSSYDLDGELETAAFAPVYPATEDLAQKRLRELRGQVLGSVRDVGEPLPAALRAREGIRSAPTRSPRCIGPATCARRRPVVCGSRSTSSSSSNSPSPARPR